MTHVYEPETRRRPSSKVSKHLNVRYPRSEVFYNLDHVTGQRSGLSADSAGSTEAEDEEDEPLPGPSRSKWDFFKPFAGARPSKDLGSNDEVEGEDEDESKEEEEEDESGWIVEDDGSEGVPELPVAFNMSSHQDLSHHFKIICQLFVHLAVRSPSRRVSFMSDIKAGKHMNTLSHDTQGPFKSCWLVQPKTVTFMLPCQRCDER